jgi:hypothetical protein
MRLATYRRGGTVTAAVALDNHVIAMSALHVVPTKVTSALADGRNVDNAVVARESFGNWLQLHLAAHRNPGGGESPRRGALSPVEAEGRSRATCFLPGSKCESRSTASE